MARRLAPIAAFLIAIAPWQVRAADPDPDPQAQAPPTARTAPPSASTADFFFGPPRVWFSIRGSVLIPRASGDLFTFVSDQLTVDRSDLRAGGFGADFGTVLTPAFDFVIGFDMNRNETLSEYRHFIGSNDQPITQQNQLRQSGLSTGIRFTPGGRGHRISNYAFIPRRITPFGGAGMSVAYYSFSQQGQFVDYTDLAIFTDRFTSDGWSVGPYLQGGADVQAWKHLFITFDARYTWMRSDHLDADFTGFEGIDLAGFRGGTGISIVF